MILGGLSPTLNNRRRINRHGTPKITAGFRKRHSANGNLYMTPEDVVCIGRMPQAFLSSLFGSHGLPWTHSRRQSGKFTFATAMAYALLYSGSVATAAMPHPAHRLAVTLKATG